MINSTERHLCWAAVKDGKLIIEHPENGPYPIIIPNKGIRIIVNGIERKEKIVVTKKDDILLIPQHERSEGSWNLVIAPDRMTAWVQIKPTIIIKRYLKDIPPAAEIYLQTDEIITPQSPLNLNDLMKEIAKHKIKYGIDIRACQEAANCLDEKEIVIAQGVNPVKGEDARIELLFQENEKTVMQVSEDEEIINWKERFIFNAVTPGTVLARKYPPQPGKPGTNIMGELVLPPMPKDIQLVAGKGTSLIKNGTEIVATAAGRPQAIISHEKVTVNIINSLIVPQDVDITLGNVHFTGDVFIQGNVNEGLEVEAGENVIINGMVSEATVKAGGSIIIKGNVLSSRIIAGGATAPIKGLIPLLEIIKTRMEELANAAKQLLLYVDKVPLLVNMLLDKKFKNIPDAIKALIVYVNKNAISDEQLIQLFKLLEDKFIKRRTSIEKLEDITYLKAQLEILINKFNVMAAGNQGCIKIPYALNSSLESIGTVEVIGIGCDNTFINAGEDVIISGAFRGGKIISGKNVFVKEIGTRGGIKTLVQVPRSSTVTIGKSYENVSITIGNYTYNARGYERNVRLRLNTDGYINIVPIDAKEIISPKNYLKTLKIPINDPKMV